jgi:uncharacterized membrane protein (UPF0127 family)
MVIGQLYRDQAPWVARVEVAATLPARMRGLLGRSDLPAGQGLLIEACGSVHTVGMRFALDVVFLDAAWRVRRVCRQVPPGRWLVWGGWLGLRALEVRAGWLDLDGLTPGTRLEWRA